ncbi:MAG TPA: thiamine pyrophosphate-binding protein [Candidatus Acidoferrales bacterium]|nr:thiamine pyrophosphate-binding protein [Candidatus Acidoferrales bacterium]
MTTVGRLIGDRLRAAGVRYVMGHPGGEVVDLIEGFRAAGLEFVLTRHETSAAFMADAMAAATGVPGTCVATLGPGATKLVTGIAQAYLDRSPLLAFSGQLPSDRYEITTHQKLDLRALYAPITKWQARVSAANAGDVTDRALRVAQRPRRGPVFLEVPSDVPRQDAGESAPSSESAALRALDPGAVDAAARVLKESRRPLILVGADANDDPTAAAVRAFAEDWSIPVLDSPKGKGAFPEDHPLFIGTIEMLGTARLYALIDTCDVVFMIGFDPVEFDRDWTAAARVVHLNVVPNDDRYYRAEVELVGTIHAALVALRARAGAKGAKWPASEIAKIRDEFRAFVSPSRSGLTAQQVIAALRKTLPRDAIATCDVGYNKAVTGQCWTAYTPKTFFMSNGLSSMGYGLPAAIGLKLVHRERAVACVVGDGGFAMTMSELETAKRLGLAVIVVVLADDALSQIKAGQERKGYPVTGTTFGALDYVALARGFGATGYEAKTLAECRDAFASARDASAPVVIAAHVDPSAYQLG